MSHVKNFVAGAFATRKIANNWRLVHQFNFELELKVVFVVVGGSRVFYVVY